jgi:DNA-binding transcriptional MocR family regulator
MDLIGMNERLEKDQKMLEKTESDRIAGVPNVVGRILSFIDERRYQPSERLPSERDFADRFNVSRGPFARALAALESMRVIERRPNSESILEILMKAALRPSFFVLLLAYRFSLKRPRTCLKCEVFWNYRASVFPATEARSGHQSTEANTLQN